MSLIVFEDFKSFVPMADGIADRKIDYVMRAIDQGERFKLKNLIGEQLFAGLNLTPRSVELEAFFLDFVKPYLVLASYRFYRLQADSFETPAGLTKRTNDARAQKQEGGNRGMYINSIGELEGLYRQELVNELVKKNSTFDGIKYKTPCYGDNPPNTGSFTITAVNPRRDLLNRIDRKLV